METATAVRPTYQELPVDKIQPSPHQARKDFDEVGIKGLAESMKQEGLLEPILVRQVNGIYELISGERRLRAAKLLVWKTIEAKVIQTVSDAEAAAKGLVENIQRQDLNPIEEAEGFQTLNQLDPKYWNQPEIAKVAGKTQGYVSDSLRLLVMPAEILENIRRRILSRSHGLELLKLSSQDDKIKAAKEVISKDLSRTDTRQLVSRTLGKDSPKPRKIQSTYKDDPMGEIWVKISGYKEIQSQAAWEVIHPNTKTWTFQVKPSGDDHAESLAGWFESMTNAIKAANLGTVQTEKGESLPAGRQASFGPFPREVRLPQSQAEEQELETAARQGPTAFYIWVFGQNSPHVQEVKGKTWQEVIGLSDPKEAMDTFIQGYKMMKAGSK